jgi:hypothetical protein
MLAVCREFMGKLPLVFERDQVNRGAALAMKPPARAWPL